MLNDKHKAELDDLAADTWPNASGVTSERSWSALHDYVESLITEAVAAVTGYTGRIAWDASKPDGTPRKLLDVSRLAALGWSARIGLRAGLEKTYASFLAESASGALRS